MLIVEFDIDSPILRTALRRAPETTLIHDEQYVDGDDILFLFWAEGGDLDGFDDGLAADPTVTEPTILAETDSRRLYRVTFTDDGEEVATFPEWSRLDIVVLESRATSEGWHVRMRMPDRETLMNYREACRDRDLDFQVTAVYHSDQAIGPADAALTECQREALLTAYEVGYFQIPRQVTLDDVAAELDISSQAASERIRRGVNTLVAETLAP